MGSPGDGPDDEDTKVDAVIRRSLGRGDSYFADSPQTGNRTISPQAAAARRRAELREHGR